jgi:hypothetical protein
LELIEQKKAVLNSMDKICDIISRRTET